MFLCFMLWARFKVWAWRCGIRIGVCVEAYMDVHMYVYVYVYVCVCARKGEKGGGEAMWWLA